MVAIVLETDVLCWCPKVPSVSYRKGLSKGCPLYPAWLKRKFEIRVITLKDRSKAKQTLWRYKGSVFWLWYKTEKYPPLFIKRQTRLKVTNILLLCMQKKLSHISVSSTKSGTCQSLKAFALVLQLQSLILIFRSMHCL